MCVNFRQQLNPLIVQNSSNSIVTMTDSSQEQRSQTERQIHQQKWEKFANNLRHSVETEHGGNGEDQQPSFDLANGLKSPVLSEEQSDLGTESSNGNGEDGFELVIKKRNRSQKQKQVNGSVWNGTSILKDSSSNTNSANNTASPPITQHSTTNISTQLTKLRVTPATNTTASTNSKNAQNKNLTTKTSSCKSITSTFTYESFILDGLIRCMEEGAAENEQEKDMSNSSDSAFAENQSPSHGSSTSLHFIGASENQTFSDSVALSDEEKWPELSVGTKNNDAAIKSTTSPSSPKTSEVIFKQIF